MEPLIYLCVDPKYIIISLSVFHNDFFHFGGLMPKNVKIKASEAEAIMTALWQFYPEAKAELDYSNPFELLIAVILSAQCTDKRVNQVTEVLFQTLKKPSDIHHMTLVELEDIIKTCGLYHAKGKHIYETCQILSERYNDTLPSTREALMTLPGVGRKTANVVISNAFGTPAIAVDTHVNRVSNRIGFTTASAPDAVEQDLMKLLKKEHWTVYHHVLIFHGRRICHARKPSCGACVIYDHCRYPNKEGQ